ncbi:MAG: hypothetical protein EXR93_10495 [Gemmatimonadetes bacterium]|nr:hypothetical protein [Gemmatimonadota bacterium]
MGKLFKLLVLLCFVGGLAYGFSYAGARTGIGKMLGSPKPEVGEREMAFLWEGADSLPGKPKVWEVTFSRVAAIGNRRAVVYVSPGGAIVATYPNDLASRLEAAAKAKDEP